MDGHMVGFIPTSMKLRFWKNGAVDELQLAGEVSMEFGIEKSCIGYNDGEALHRCPRSMRGSKQCPACASRDISRMYTRLDYAGFERFYEKFKNQGFSVYLASFGHLVKCGVTRTARLNERVREQGADYFCELAKTEDAETAYSIESFVHNNFAIRNGITSAQKLKLMAAPSAPGRLEEILEKVKESGVIAEWAGEMKTTKLDYPIPASFSESNSIEGEILGTKGQVLFYEKNGAAYAVNMSKKTGSFFSYSLMGS